MSHLDKNLTALREQSPELANLIADTPIPPDFKPTTGSDNSPTYLRTSTNPKKLHWLGNTSMPTASAKPLIAALDPNPIGLALSIGTGHEWAAFLPLLPPAHPLYLYEPDPALLHMALTICDLSAPLSSGKLLILSGSPEHAASTLTHFLNTHLGYDPPTVLQPLPTLTPDRRNALQSAAESIVRTATLTRQSLLNQLITQLNQMNSEQSKIENQKSKIKNPLALLLTSRDPGERPLHHLIESQNIPTLFLDQLGSSSLALRLDMLIKTRPTKILSDLYRPQLQVIPNHIPIETWIPPNPHPPTGSTSPTPTPSNPPPALTESSTTAAPTKPASNPTASPPKTSTSSPFPPPSTLIPPPTSPPSTPSITPITPPPSPPLSALVPQSLSAFPPTIALYADLPSIDPDTLAIILPTHLAVYHAARQLIADEYLTVHFGSAPDLLRRALTRAGVPHNTPDPSLQDPMLRIIRDVLIPAIPLFTLAQTLHQQGLPLLLLGHWPTPDPLPSSLCRSVASSLPQDTALYLHLSPHGTVPTILWQAITYNIPILSPEHPSDPQPGSLATLLKPDTDYAHPRPQNLLNTLKSLLKESTRRTALTQSARRHLPQIP